MKEKNLLRKNGARLCSRMQKKSNASDEQIDKIFNFLTERDSVGPGD